MSPPAATAVDPDDVSFLHEAALAHGLDSLLVANRVLLVNHPGNEVSVCLAQGVPPTTSQAAAAIASDQVVVRQLMQGEGLPVPGWRALRFTDDAGVIAGEAAAVGFPLVARAGWGGRQPVAHPLAPVVPEAGALGSAVAILRTAAGPRSARPRQPRGRFMLEAVVAEQQLLVLLVGSEPVAVVREQVGTGAPAIGLVLSDVHRELRDLAARAAGVLPDLGVAAVRLVVQDHAAPLRQQPHAVVAVDVYPGLAVHDRAEAGAGRALARAILAAQAGRSGVTLLPPRPDITVDIRAEGVPSTEQARSAFVAYLGQHGISGSLEAGADADADQLRGRVQGSPREVAGMCDALIEGRLDRVRPLSVAVGHTGSIVGAV